ncbi:hypothetical protein FJT64_023805 [Amphibalanus amphitrite]|uniref:Uncharacterized protein n=1 Tax=Amphibalanus amphitrite TaxID=1232801 RepID=A0A6A4WQN0_AMPAM|nr:hypothetical protein FJT64_023805 [Amphibalanus amphitrite]
MHRADMVQTCTMDDQELWDDHEEDTQQESGTSMPEPVTLRQMQYRRGCVSESRADSPARLWPTRPVSLSSASSSDSGVRGDMSDASSVRQPFTGLSADSGCSGWDQMDEDDWDSCSDASGEYEPLREPLPPLLEVRGTPAYNRSLTHPLPPPPPPRPPPGTLPRRKDLTRHLGLPRELGGSLAELRAGNTARRKDLGLFLGMAEPSTPPRPGLWRRWASKRGPRPERDRSADPRNGSLPDLARLAVGGDTVSMPATPCRRRAAASPRLLRAALRRVQERALRAVARTGTAEVPGLEEDGPTLVFQAKRGSFEAPSILFSGDRWQAPSRPRPSQPIAIRHKPRLATPPPELPTAASWSPADWSAAAEHRLPPPPPQVPPPADTDAEDDGDDDPTYMTMEAIRALGRPPLPPPRVTVESCDEGEESGYLSMDAVRQLVRAHRAASPTRPRLGSDYANLADLRSALAGLRLATAAGQS